MDTILRNTKASSRQLYLDPRTKILLCITVSTVMLAMDNTGIFAYIIPVMTIVPLIFLAIIKSPMTAVYYGILYLVAFFVPKMIVAYLPQAVNLLFTGVLATMTRLIPGMSMFYFLIATTSVSEFIAAMERMHIPKVMTVPVSVMFRFFPTIVEEYHGITDAMRLRNVGSFRNPVDMLEYRLVPLMISLTAIGNDLSISALTRGLDAPNKRSNMCAIGFNVQDYIAIAVSVVILILAALSMAFGI